MTDVAALLALHASLPEPRQPAWGLGAGQDATKRAHDERLKAILPLLEALPHEGALRILDVDCAQGYFSLAIAHALAARGRSAEVVGVDPHEQNIRFCEALALHHGAGARFVCAAFDVGFVERQEHARWDAILVLGDSIVAADANEKEIVATISLLRKHSRVMLCEVSQDQQPSDPNGAWRMSSDRLLASNAFCRQLASFTGLPGGAPRVLCACSDHLAWVGRRWFAFDRVTDRAHAGVPSSFAGQRRFFLGVDAVIKAFQGGGRHGTFNRAELANEAAALQALRGKSGRYPVVLAQADDGDVVWLARESLPGEPLSERMASGGINRDVVARGLIAELALLESLGFYHADLRCWNVLVNGEEVRLIDFGAMTRMSSALQRLALCAVLLEVASGKAGHEQPFYASLHPLSTYPAAWHPLLRYLLGTAQSAFRYQEALRILESSLDGDPRLDVMAGGGMEFDDELLSCATQEHCEAFLRLRDHDEAMERALSSAERAHAAELAEVRSLRARVHELQRAQKAAEREHTKHAGALESALEQSRSYASSLEARLEREAADAYAEHEALEASRQAATQYSDSLKQSLDTSREYVDSLRGALARSQAYASSLEERIELGKRNLEAVRMEHARMQRRFRLLKFMWPREPEDPKEPE
jgi:SAM-dependent methyltransferase